MHKYLKEDISASIKKGKRDISQFIVIVLSALIGYVLFDHNPGENVLDWDLIIRVSVLSLLVLVILLFFTYHLQKYVAASLGGKIHYEFWPWGIFATVVLSILSIGRLVFYMPGIFWLDKKLHGVGRRLPDASRVESAAVAGVGPTLGLLVATFSIGVPYVSVTAATYAVWSLLPIPKTNGFHYFNWHPLHGGFTGILGLVLLAMYVFAQISVFLVIITIIFFFYQWLYVYVLARRTGY